MSGNHQTEERMTLSPGPWYGSCLLPFEDTGMLLKQAIKKQINNILEVPLKAFSRSTKNINNCLILWNPSNTLFPLSCVTYMCRKHSSYFCF